MTDEELKSKIEEQMTREAKSIVTIEKIIDIKIVLNKQPSILKSYFFSIHFPTRIHMDEKENRNYTHDIKLYKRNNKNN